MDVRIESKERPPPLSYSGAIFYSYIIIIIIIIIIIVLYTLGLPSFGSANRTYLRCQHTEYMRCLPHGASWRERAVRHVALEDNHIPTIFPERSQTIRVGVWIAC